MDGILKRKKETNTEGEAFRESRAGENKREMDGWRKETQDTQGREGMFSSS